MNHLVQIRLKSHLHNILLSGFNNKIHTIVKNCIIYFWLRKKKLHNNNCKLCFFFFHTNQRPGLLIDPMVMADCQVMLACVKKQKSQIQKDFDLKK